MNLTKILAGVLLLLAIVLGIGAWMLGKDPARPATAAASTSAFPTPKTELHAVVVAARPIAAGQRLAAEDLKVAQFPAAIAHSTNDTSTVLGRTTTVALATDAPLFEQHLISGLALQLEPGQRAVSVAVREPMAAGHHVRPGDFVDVFFTLEDKSGETKVDAQTRLLLARTRVLAYGGASVENPPSAAQGSDANGAASSQRMGSNARQDGPNGRQNPANTAVLALPLSDVQRLTLAEKFGHLSLALRHPDDTSNPDPTLFAALPTVLQPAAGRLKAGEPLPAMDRSFAGLRFKDLATGAEAKNARPVKTTPQISAARPSTVVPRSPQTIEVYRGAAMETVSY